MDNQDERACAGLLFDTAWPPYRTLKARTHDLCRRYNTLDDLDPERERLIPQIFAEVGEGFHVRGPLYVNCGFHTRIGCRFFANFNVTILDDVPVSIGDDVQLAPGVTIIAGTHPLLSSERLSLTYPDGHTGGAEYGDPVVIEDRVWVGANVTVLPGVTIGHDAVVGAGALVTRDVPAGWLALGVPAHPVREITEADSLAGSATYPGTARARLVSPAHQADQAPSADPAPSAGLAQPARPAQPAPSAEPARAAEPAGSASPDRPASPASPDPPAPADPAGPLRGRLGPKRRPAGADWH